MSFELLPLLTRGVLDPLSPITRGDSRTFRYAAATALTGATLQFRLASQVFEISKSSGSGITLDPLDPKVALIDLGGPDWTSYPDSAQLREVHHIELKITLSGRVETVVRDLPIVVFR